MVATMLSSMLALAMTVPMVHAAALPTPYNTDAGISARTFDWAGPDWLRKNLAKSMPTVDGLPSNSNATLKRIVVGLGVQNYTCENTASAPKAAGALATLYDTTWLFFFDRDAIDDISSKYLKAYESRSCTKFGQTDVTYDCCEDAVNDSKYRLRTAGHHYFENRAGKGVPFFDLNTRRQQQSLSAGLVASVKAPVDQSSVGANGASAVNWLFLADDKSGKSNDLTEVYRVKTAGGAALPDACKSGQKTFGVKYAAQYWFYE